MVGGRTWWVSRVCRMIEGSKSHRGRERRMRRNERGEAGNGVGFENDNKKEATYRG